MHHPGTIAGLLAFAAVTTGIALLAGLAPIARPPSDAAADAEAVDCRAELGRIDARLTDLHGALAHAEAERRRLEQEYNRLRVELSAAENTSRRHPDGPREALPARHDQEARLFDLLDQLRPVYEAIARVRAEIEETDEQRREIRDMMRGTRTPASP